MFKRCRLRCVILCGILSSLSRDNEHLVAISGTAILGPYHFSQVTAPHLKIGYELMQFTGTQTSSKLQWLVQMTGYQISSASNDHQPVDDMQYSWLYYVIVWCMMPVAGGQSVFSDYHKMADTDVPLLWSTLRRRTEKEHQCGHELESCHWHNSLWPSDAIWWHRSGSSLAQVMAWCLTAPSHYLNHCWLIIIALIGYDNIQQ